MRERKLALDFVAAALAAAALGCCCSWLLLLAAAVAAAVVAAEGCNDPTTNGYVALWRVDAMRGHSFLLDTNTSCVSNDFIIKATCNATDTTRDRTKDPKLH